VKSMERLGLISSNKDPRIACPRCRAEMLDRRPGMFWCRSCGWFLRLL
jgi:ribosomal protein L37AE/L43A